MFNIKEKKEAKSSIEESLVEKFKSSPILDDLLYLIMKDINKSEQNEDDDEKDDDKNDSSSGKWMISGQSYYDGCSRTVMVGLDLFRIVWGKYYQDKVTDKNGMKQTVWKSKIGKKVEYSYTDFGYVPLHQYYNNGVKIDEDRICYLWATAIKERMAEMMPMCKFGFVEKRYVNLDDEERVDHSRAEFTYTVPPLEFNDWF